MSYAYSFRPSRFGRMAGARYRASQRVPYARRYGAFGTASRSRVRSYGRGAPRFAGRYGMARVAPRVFRPGFDRTGGAYKRALYNPNADKAEIKNFDVLNTVSLALTNPLSVSVGSVTGAPLELLTQGVGENQRIGRKICVKSVHFRGNCEFVPQAASQGWDRAVIMLVLDTQCNGAFPANPPTDVFSSTNPAAFLLNLDNTNRFRILKTWSNDFNASVQDVGGVTLANQIRHVDMYVPMNMEVMYSAATGAIAEIRDNNLFLAYGSSNGECIFGGSSRVRFTDA